MNQHSLFRLLKHTHTHTNTCARVHTHKHRARTHPHPHACTYTRKKIRSRVKTLSNVTFRAHVARPALCTYMGMNVVLHTRVRFNSLCSSPAALLPCSLYCMHASNTGFCNPANSASSRECPLPVLAHLGARATLDRLLDHRLTNASLFVDAPANPHKCVQIGHRKKLQWATRLKNSKCRIPQRRVDAKEREKGTPAQGSLFTCGIRGVLDVQLDAAHRAILA